MARDSAIVAVARVGAKPWLVPAAEGAPADDPTKSRMSLITVLVGIKGAGVGRTLVFRQSDTPPSSVVVEDAQIPALQPGATYLLYLQPFYFRRGVDRGEWCIVGYAAYRAAADGTFKQTLSRPELPRTLTVEQARASVRG